MTGGKVDTMNDIIERNTELHYINEALNKATARVVKLGNAIRNNLFEVAHIIAEVAETECFKDDGFDSAVAWAEKSFGFKKSAVYDLLKIGREYTRPRLSAKGNVTGYGSNLIEEGEADDFSTSQIKKMLPLDHDKVVDLVDEGTITVDMSCREIEKVVKGILNPEGEGNDEGNGEGNDEDTVESTAEEVTRDLTYFTTAMMNLMDEAREELTDEDYDAFVETFADALNK